MPRDVVVRPRSVIEADQRIEPSPMRGDWVALDEADTHVEVSLARMQSYIALTDTIVEPFVADWNEGDSAAECIRITVWISYDNGTTWQRVGHVGTGPDIKRKRVSADPDAVRPPHTHTRARWEIPAQNGRTARLVRYEVDCKRRMTTELRIGSDDLPRKTDAIRELIR